ncbi:MAG: hemerythrin domain-containing protein [Planctomycetes bacterium]|nr:hemerythrin domain-containing protein [Planctomycetota bacterium]
MRSTDILQSEHRVIEQVLACLEKMAEQAHARGRLDEVSARQAIDFFQTFADRCHHAKEEAHLFPMMESKGFPRHGGPTGVMLHEHEEGRTHIRAMLAAVEAAGAGDEAAVRDFTVHARAFVQLLRLHIFKEDHRLFPMASQVCSPANDANLVERFAQSELDETEPGVHEHYLELAQSLAERFGVAPAKLTTCGCGH